MRLSVKLLGFAVSVGLTAFAAHQFGDEVRFAFDALPAIDVVALYGAIILITGISALRWWHLLRARGLPLPLLQVLEITWIAQAINVLTPGGVSGDLFKVILVRGRSEGIRKRELLGTIALDRIIGVLGLAATIAVAVLAASRDLFGSLEFGNLWMVALLVIGGGLAVLGFLLADHLVGDDQSFLGRNLTAIADVVRTILGLSRNLGLMVWTSLITLVGNLILSFALWRILSAFGEVGFGIVVLLVALSFLVSLLPVTINGLGTRDMVFAMVLTPIGFAPHESLTASLLCFAAVTFASVLGGVVAWFHMNGLTNPLKWVKASKAANQS